MRILGYLFVLLGLGALTLDVLAADGTKPFMLRPLDQTWFELDRQSWLLVQPALERHVHPDLYFKVVAPIAQQPAALLFGGVGAVLVILSMLLFRRRRSA